MADVGIGDELISLLIVSMVAFVIPIITRRLGIPVIVGEIGFGILVGIINGIVYSMTGHHIIEFTDGGGLDFMAELGLIFLLFLAGLEIDVNIIEQKGKWSIGLGAMMFAITFGLCWGFMYILGLGVYMALILSTTSVGVVIPILREMKLSKTALGQDIILAAVVADFGTMMLIPVVKLIETDPTASAFDYFLRFAVIGLIFLIFFVFFMVGGLAMWKWPRDMAKFFRSDDPAELGVRAAFLILMSFAVVSFTFFSDAILGAFLAGAAINFIFRESAVLERKLFGFGYGFLIPLFFIRTGVEFTEMVKPSGLLIVPALVGIAILVKIIPSLLFAKEHGMRNTMATGVLMSARLSLLIAAINIGIRAEIEDVQEYAPSLLILALVMCVIAPIGFKYLYTPPKGLEEASEVEPTYELMMTGEDD